jgi:hypothetical protein
MFIQLHDFSNQYNKIINVTIEPSAILHPMFQGNLKLTFKLSRNTQVLCEEHYNRIIKLRSTKTCLNNGQQIVIGYLKVMYGKTTSFLSNIHWLSINQCRVFLIKKIKNITHLCTIFFLITWVET